MTQKTENLAEKFIIARKEREKIEVQLNEIKSIEEEAKRKLGELLMKEDVKTYNWKNYNITRVIRPVLKINDEIKLIKFCQAKFTNGLRLSLNKAAILKEVRNGAKIPETSIEKTESISVKELEI